MRVTIVGAPTTTPASTTDGVTTTTSGTTSGAATTASQASTATPEATIITSGATTATAATSEASTAGPTTANSGSTTTSGVTSGAPTTITSAAATATSVASTATSEATSSTSGAPAASSPAATVTSGSPITTSGATATAPGTPTATSGAATGTSVAPTVTSGATSSTSGPLAETSAATTVTTGSHTATSGATATTSGAPTATSGAATVTSGAPTATSGTVGLTTVTSGASTATSGTTSTTSGTQTASSRAATTTYVAPTATSGATSSTSGSLAETSGATTVTTGSQIATSGATATSGAPTATSEATTTTSGAPTATSGAIITVTSGTPTATSGTTVTTSGAPTATSGATTVTSGSQTATSGATFTTSGAPTASSAAATPTSGTPIATPGATAPTSEAATATQSASTAATQATATTSAVTTATSESTTTSPSVSTVSPVATTIAASVSIPTSASTAAPTATTSTVSATTFSSVSSTDGTNSPGTTSPSSSHTSFSTATSTYTSSTGTGTSTTNSGSTTGSAEESSTSASTKTGTNTFTSTTDSGNTGSGTTAGPLGQSSTSTESACTPNTCKNEGTCVEEATGYSCDCQKGFIGEHCEQSSSAGEMGSSTPGSSTGSLCTDEPCQNGGTCTENSSGYACECLPAYIGENCEKEGPLAIAINIDPTDENSFQQTENVLEEVTKAAEGTDDFGTLETTSTTLKVLTEKVNDATWTEEQLSTATQDLLESSKTVIESLRIASVRQPAACADCTNHKQQEKKEAAVETITEVMSNIGALALKNKEEGSVSLSVSTMEVFSSKATTSELVRDKERDTSDDNVKTSDVLLPSRLLDTVGDESLVLTKIEIDKDLYSHATEKVDVAGSVIKVALKKASGELVSDLDPDAPVTMYLKPTSSDSSNVLDLHKNGATSTAVQKLTLGSNVSYLLMDLQIPPGTTVEVKGRFAELPRSFERDFEFRVNSDGSEWIVKHKIVQIQLSEGKLSLLVYNNIQHDQVYMIIKYTDGVGNRGRRQATPTTLSFWSVKPKVWNSELIKWVDDPNVKVTGFSKNGDVEFKSNFFGTFALSEVIIPPNPIDFEKIFLNFDTYIRESPYVLAVNCVLVFTAMLIAIYLRRLDRSDRQLWKYYPLVDNNNSDPYRYSFSIHTSIRSVKNLSCIPYFILIGKDGETKPKVLADGCRKHFYPGSVSNFYMSTDADLGELRFIKMWHDDRGGRTKWHVDRIVIVDLQKRVRYLFMCQKWLANDEDDGRICRTFEAFTDDADISMVDVLSKQKLFDDHLWLSVVKRPMFSRFTRVQRFLCAVAMLFLAMVTNAMWFKDYDSGTQKTRGIQLGPVHFNYRQLFAGAASAVVIMVPGILITLAFRKRKLRKENTEDNGCNCIGYVTGKVLLPWWFIFVGYSLVFAAIGISAFFTFLYSLEWGGETSLNWLMSLVFCTTGSTLLVEPLKILIVSIALAAVFKRTVQDDIGIVAPLTKVRSRGILSIVGTTVRPEVPEPPDEDEEEIKRRKEQLHLKQKLMVAGKSITVKLILVGVLAIICLHNDVVDSFRLNTLVKTYVNSSYIKKNVHQPMDVWKWFDVMFIPSVLPKHNYNTKLMSVYDQRFAKDLVNYRVGPIILRQFRVKGNCEYNVLTSSYRLPALCIPSFAARTEETRAFDTGWKTCDSPDNCIDNAFLYSHSSAGSYTGAHGTYGNTGYQEAWSGDQRLALSRRTYLENKTWFDSNSRALLVEVSFYNPNVRLFTLLRTLFEFPAVGNVHGTVTASTARLYPYVNVWDYLVLLIQIGFVVLVVVRMCNFCHTMFCSKERSLGMDTLVFVFEMSLSVCAAVVYGVKIDLTIFVVEKLRNQPDEFVSFDMVQQLDDVFRFTISMVLFIRILHLMKPLSMNYSLFLMRKTLMTSRKELCGFSVILAVIMTSFASFFYLLEGPLTFDIRTFWNTYMALTVSLLGLVRSRQLQFTDTGFETYYKQIMFTFFYFIVTLALINIAISVLNTHMGSSKGHNDLNSGPEFDHGLNAYMWRTFDKFFKKCYPRSRPETTSTVEPMEDDVFVNYQMNQSDYNIGGKLDKMLVMITNSNNADVLFARSVANRALQELTTAQNQLRQTEQEVEIVKQEISHLKDAVGRLSEDRRLSEIRNCDMELQILEHQEENQVTISVDDRNRSVSLLSQTSKDSPTSAEYLKSIDVTDSEKGTLSRDFRRLYGNVYKCETSQFGLHVQNQQTTIQFILSSEPHPYEDVRIATRMKGAKKWKFSDSSCNAKHPKTPGLEDETVHYTVESEGEGFPEYIACVSEPKVFVHPLTPAGGVFSVPFEPRARLYYEKGCASTGCDVTIIMIPRHPVPILQVIPGGNLVYPIKVELPVASDMSCYGSNPEWSVLSSTCDNMWWKAPTEIAVEDSVVVFLAYTGPANSKVAFCPKVSELHWVKRIHEEQSPEALIQEAEDETQRPLQNWSHLSAVLGRLPSDTHPSNKADSSPADICRHVLSQWRDDVNKAFREALKKIDRHDAADWLDTQDCFYRTLLADKSRRTKMTKAFSTVVDNLKICELWNRLAKAVPLSKEEITRIDCGSPRTNGEKTFLVLMHWWQQNLRYTLRDVQELLQNAGFTLEAKKILQTE